MKISNKWVLKGLPLSHFLIGILIDRAVEHIALIGGTGCPITCQPPS